MESMLSKLNLSQAVAMPYLADPYKTIDSLKDSLLLCQEKFTPEYIRELDKQAFDDMVIEVDQISPESLYDIEDQSVGTYLNLTRLSCC